MAIVCEDCEQGTEVHFTAEQLTSMVRMAVSRERMSRMAVSRASVGGYMRPLGYGLIAFRRWVEVTDSAGDVVNASTGYRTAIINAAGKTIHETKGSVGI